MRNQPSLSTSTGNIWLGIGAVMTVIVLIVLVPMLTLNAPIAGTGIALVVLLLVGLVIARFRVQAGKPRLMMMASLFIGIAVVGLLTVLLVSGVQVESIARI